MKICKATANDIPSMIDLARESATAAHWSQQQYMDLLSPVAVVDRLAIVAEGSLPSTPAMPAEGLLGFLIARFLPPECELENIVVSPAAQREGIGRQLLDALRRAAHETNCESVFLEVRESNQTARAFYEHIGFHLEGRRRAYYSNPAEDALLYRLMVGPS